MGDDLGRELGKAELCRARAVDALREPVKLPEHPLARIHALLQRRAAELAGLLGEVLEDRGGLAEMPPVRIVDEQRHLAEALLRKILRPLMLALAQIDVHV